MPLCGDGELTERSRLTNFILLALEGIADGSNGRPPVADGNEGGWASSISLGAALLHVSVCSIVIEIAVNTNLDGEWRDRAMARRGDGGEGGAALEACWDDDQDVRE